MEQEKKANVFEWMDGLPFGRFHAIVLVLIGLVLTSAGFSLQVLAYAMPLITREWSLSAVQAGAMVSYGFLGLMTGALAFGVIADRVGRKRALIAAVGAFSLIGSFAAFAPGYASFCLMRFFSGIGIGGAFPLAVALLSEFSPSRTRGRLVTAAVSGFTLGWAVAASLSMALVPHYGWRSVFLFGLTPLLFLVPLWLLLPESVRFLVEHGRKREALKAVRTIEKRAGLTPVLWNERDLPSPSCRPRSAFTALFRGRLASMTLLVWCTYFLNNLALYGLSVWLPSLLMKEGFSLVRSYGYTMVQAGGSAVGGFILGCLMDRFGRKPGLMLIYLAGGLSVILFGSVIDTFSLFLAGAATGVFVLGTPTALNVVCSEIYPTNVRSTGIASTQAAGRIGSILGPMAGGALQGYGVAFHQFFLFFAVPCFICMILVGFYPINVRGEALETVDEKAQSAGRA